jgi:TRAP-type C4-dicarboxylate transport system permease small subunit
MTLVVVLQVICRYLLGASLTWSEELARYSLVWITFLGAGTAMKRRAHMGLEAAVGWLPPKVQELAKLVTLLSILGFLGVATVQGVRLALFNMSQHSPAMGIPMGIAYFAIPIGCFFMLVHGVEQMLNFLPSLTNGHQGSSR